MSNSSGQSFSIILPLALTLERCVRCSLLRLALEYSLNSQMHQGNRRVGVRTWPSIRGSFMPLSWISSFQFKTLIYSHCTCENLSIQFSWICLPPFGAMCMCKGAGHRTSDGAEQRLTEWRGNGRQWAGWIEGAGQPYPLEAIRTKTKIV